MNGVTIIETEVLNRLIATVETMHSQMSAIADQMHSHTKPYLSVTDVCAFTGFGKTWVNDNKADIGFSSIGAAIRFKRADVVSFMDANYFKKSKRKSA